MKFLSQIICLAAALFMTACVGDASLQLTSTHMVSEDCTANTSVILASGSIDVSKMGDAGGTYIMGLLVENFMNSSATDTASANRNNVNIRHILVEATIDGEVIEESIDVGGTCPAGGQLALSANILGSDTYEKLLSAATEDPQTATLKLKVKGKLMGGEWIVSPGYVFPLEFYASGESPLDVERCLSAGGQFTILSGSSCSAVMEGQDGKTYVCEMPESDASK